MPPKNKNILLIIDPQVDFHPGGSLAVPGANEDSARIASLISENIEEIDEIYVTLDSHHRTHIAHGICWLNSEGKHPDPFTLISHQDIVDGVWKPRNADLLNHCLAYTDFLETQGKFKLCIWPEHCLIGSAGHSVVPVLNGALQKWAGSRFKEVHYVMKGQNCLTEMYSAIQADYVIESDPRTKRDPALLKELQDTENLLICGQALSHCVNFTFCDILETWPVDQREKLILLTDASSPVGGFETQASEFVDKIKKAGCTLKTTGGCNHVLPNPSSLPVVESRPVTASSAASIADSTDIIGNMIDSVISYFGTPEKASSVTPSK